MQQTDITSVGNKGCRLAFFFICPVITYLVYYANAVDADTGQKVMTIVYAIVAMIIITLIFAFLKTFINLYRS